jgi:hypothetical protein
LENFQKYSKVREKGVFVVVVESVVFSKKRAG